jgi:hypothetical protein
MFVICRDFSFDNIIQFVQSNQSCNFSLQDIPSLIRHGTIICVPYYQKIESKNFLDFDFSLQVFYNISDSIRIPGDEETCTLFVTFNSSSLNGNIHVSKVVVGLHSNDKTYKFSTTPYQCIGNTNLDQVQMHLLCHMTKGTVYSISTKLWLPGARGDQT